MKGKWIDTGRGLADFRCLDKTSKWYNFWLVVMNENNTFELWTHEGGWSRQEPLPQGLSTEEAQAYALMMWRMQ